MPEGPFSCATRGGAPRIDENLTPAEVLGRGWTRKTGPIQNLDLMKTLYAKAKARPELRLQWIKAHDGARWNEYADALATTWMRNRR